MSRNARIRRREKRTEPRPHPTATVADPISATAPHESTPALPSASTIHAPGVDAILQLLAHPDIAADELFRALGLTPEAFEQAFLDSGILPRAVDAETRIADLRARLIAARALPRAVQFLSKLLGEEEASIESRRKAAGTIIRMCHASPKEKHVSPPSASTPGATGPCEAQTRAPFASVASPPDRAGQPANTPANHRPSATVCHPFPTEKAAPPDRSWTQRAEHHARNTALLESHALIETG